MKKCRQGIVHFVSIKFISPFLIVTCCISIDEKLVVRKFFRTWTRINMNVKILNIKINIMNISFHIYFQTRNFYKSIKLSLVEKAENETNCKNSLKILNTKTRLIIHKNPQIFCSFSLTNRIFEKEETRRTFCFSTSSIFNA